MELKQALGELSLTELRDLRQALASRRLRPGDDGVALRTLGLPQRWAPMLAQLPAELPGLLALMDWGISEREAAEARRPQVISTHPGVAEPGFVETPVVLRRLFLQAREEVLLAGFRLTHRELLEPLRRPSTRALRVRLFLHLDRNVDARGAKVATEWGRDWPQRWWAQFLAEVWPERMDPPEAWYSPLTLGPDPDAGWRSMHVKTVVVDQRRWMVSSANFTERAMSRNLELGVLLEEPGSAARVRHHFEAMAKAGIFRRLDRRGDSAA